MQCPALNDVIDEIALKIMIACDFDVTDDATAQRIAESAVRIALNR